MNTLRRVARKELAAFFATPAAFIFFGAFLTATLFIFFWVATFFSRNIADVRPMFEWMPILLIFLSDISFYFISNAPFPPTLTSPTNFR